MRTYMDCIPCFVRQALGALRQITDDEVVIERALKRVLAAASEISVEQSPPAMGKILHRIIREESGSSDPYAEIKVESNKAAMEAMGHVQELIEGSEWPFETACRFAIAGNVMDFGLMTMWDGNKLDEALDAAMGKDIDLQTVKELEDAINKADTILMLGDNAGEIVFDKLLLEQLPNPEKVTYVVRGGPVINDAVMKDAEDVGIVGLAGEVIDNGNDAPGTVLEQSSDEFRKIFDSADVVISKGQGNYETLCDCYRKVYFLTQIKCEVLARDLNGAVGDWIVKCNKA